MSLFLHTRRRRRRFIPLACVALLTLLGAALIGCGANDDEEPTETATSAVETTVTGTATTGISWPWRSIEPISFCSRRGSPRAPTATCCS